MKIRVVGVTGPAASGKTTFCKYVIQETPAVYISTDDIVHDIYRENDYVRNEMSRVLGREVFNSEGEILRRVVARKIFYNAEKRLAVETLIYPEVEKIVEQKIREIPSDKLVFIEAVKLFESGLDKLCDRVAGIVVDRWTQMERLEARGYSYSYCWAMVSSQKRISEFIDLSSCVIFNTGSLEDMKAKSLQVLDKIFKENA